MSSCAMRMTANVDNLNCATECMQRKPRILFIKRGECTGMQCYWWFYTNAWIMFQEACVRHIAIKEISWNDDGELDGTSAKIVWVCVCVTVNGNYKMMARIKTRTSEKRGKCCRKTAKVEKAEELLSNWMITRRKLLLTIFVANQKQFFCSKAQTLSLSLIHTHPHRVIYGNSNVKDANRKPSSAQDVLMHTGNCCNGRNMCFKSPPPHPVCGRHSQTHSAHKQSRKIRFEWCCMMVTMMNNALI